MRHALRGKELESFDSLVDNIAGILREPYEDRPRNIIIHRGFCRRSERGVDCPCKPFKVPTEEVSCFGAETLVAMLWPHIGRDP